MAAGDVLTPDEAIERLEAEGWSGWRARLWVLDGAGIAELWSSGSFGVPLARQPRIHRDGETRHEAELRFITRVIREAEEGARKLEAERDEYLAERAELEEMQLAVGMPG